MPKVCKLKPRANVVGELGKLSASFSVDKENKSADGIGTTTTVVEDGGEVFVTALDYVLFLQMLGLCSSSEEGLDTEA